MSVAAPRDATSIPADRNDPGALFRRGCGYLLTACVIGLAIGLPLLLLMDGASLRAALNGGFKTLSLYRSQDTVWLAVCVVFGGCLCWMLRRGAEGSNLLRLTAIWPDKASAARMTCAVAILVLIFVGAGTYLIHHAHGAVLDEYMPELQAEIFLSGRLLAPAPEDWEPMTGALFPYLFFHDPEHHLWGSFYRPVHAAIRAAFSLVSLGSLANAILTALSVLLIAGVARRLWPDRQDAAILAAVLLASGPQFLFTGMSGFAWPAHLCLNLLWLWLFLRDDRLGHGLAALVGFAAVGLHQINVHPLFVLPFMLSLLWARRWWLAVFYASVYSVAVLTWTYWNEIAVLLSAGSAPPSDLAAHGARYYQAPLSLIGLDTLIQQPLMAFNLMRLLAWQNIIILPLMFVALRPWSSAPQPIRLLAWGCILVMIPYVLIMPNQNHAWGYRYAHGLLGSLALIATHGWVVLSSKDRPTMAAAKCAIIGSTILVVVAGLPMRAIQVDGLVRPLADGNRYIHSLQSEIVLVDVSKLWFAADTFRNDPFLNDWPLVLSLQHVTADQVRQLCETYTVTIVDHEDLAQFGAVTVDRLPWPSWPSESDQDTLRAIANGPACRAS